jgi:uroporphyrinogen-III synthase
MPGQEQGFAGLRVLSLESRRGREMADLIAKSGGVPTVAPSTKEVPIGSNPEVASFAKELVAGRFDCVIFLTGVGTRLLAQEAEATCPRAELVAALSRTRVVARGPKPVAALRDLGVPIKLTVPEPNTWREILETLDQNKDAAPLEKRRVAVQEYGVSSAELLDGLRERGAEVVAVRVYQWALPEDAGPLELAVGALTRHEFDAVLLTASVQLQHLLFMAEKMKLAGEVRSALNRMVVGSIGPVTSEELRRHGIEVDLEPSHPRMGFLVKETSERAVELLRKKKGSGSRSS